MSFPPQYKLPNLEGEHPRSPFYVLVASCSSFATICLGPTTKIDVLELGTAFAFSTPPTEGEDREGTARAGDGSVTRLLYPGRISRDPETGQLQQI